jgi:hypothetical protein
MSRTAPARVDRLDLDGGEKGKAAAKRPGKLRLVGLSCRWPGLTAVGRVMAVDNREAMELWRRGTGQPCQGKSGA